MKITASGALRITKTDWVSIGKKAGWIRQATGEPDQNYDHKTYDAIVTHLTKATGLTVAHKEFDKYQGVRMTVTGGSRTVNIWTTESFVRGKAKSPTSPYQSSKLIIDGNEYSATPGDYWQMQPESVFENATLVIKKHDGSEIRKENPKKSDLVEVDGYVRYESKPSQVLVMWPDSAENDANFEVVVDSSGKVVSDGGLAAYIKQAAGGK